MRSAAPTIISTGAIVAVPRAMAATAWTPPSTYISSAPAMTIAATVSGCGFPFVGGVQAMMRSTPATFAVTIVM